jgi:hypothetical protein
LDQQLIISSPKIWSDFYFYNNSLAAEGGSPFPSLFIAQEYTLLQSISATD